VRAAPRTPAAAAILASALAAFAAGCAAVPPPPSGRTVTCITRTLADGLHLQVLEHRVRVVEPNLVAFLDAHPGLDGRLTLSDLLFLERLTESGHRHVLLESASREAAGMDGGSTEPPDRLDPVERIKVGLLREALQVPAFLEEIAGAIGDDALDPSSEHGGLVLLGSGEGCPLFLLPIPSSSAGDDHAYGLPVELFTAACLAFWHNHAVGDGGGAAERFGGPRPPGPSGAVGPSLVTAWGDRWIAYLRGIDGVVFTPERGGGFSVVFFSSEGEVLDLGRFAP
jgi:hypothetical protein